MEDNYTKEKCCGRDAAESERLAKQADRIWKEMVNDLCYGGRSLTRQEREQRSPKYNGIRKRGAIDKAINMFVYLPLWHGQQEITAQNYEYALQAMSDDLNLVAELALKAIRLKQFTILNDGESSKEEAERLVKDALAMKKIMKKMLLLKIEQNPVLIQNQLNKLVKKYTKDRW